MLGHRNESITKLSPFVVHVLHVGKLPVQMLDRFLHRLDLLLVGGAPLNEEFGKAIGADAYCRDAAVAVETAKTFMSRKHNQLATS